MSLVTLRSFPNHVEAHLLKTKLESEDIPCFIFDENMVTMNPLYNVTVGGIKVKVLEEDQARAQQLLEDMEGLPYKNDQEEDVTCPNCGSKKLYGHFISNKGIKGVLSSVSAFLLAVFPIYVRTVYKCKNCDFEFRIRR
ncbi:DUF2007 domain-containing protein [Roseivirga sp. BDSF3-8]|uniref:putative signal transducing protein n=1 Tax=Roseivirga sp. BDSF3-8 TaxID=3241598 RepID=UPI003531DA85